MRFFAIRHGKTFMNTHGIVNGEIDEPLTAEGFEQARDAVNKLPKTIKYIITSPLERAHATAQVFSQILSLPIIVSQQLTEITMGSLAGKSWDQMPSGERLKELHRSVKFNYDQYGGESAKNAIKRVREFVREIENHYHDGEVLIVTHGGILRIIHLLESGEAINETEKNMKLIQFDTTKLLSRKLRT